VHAGVGAPRDRKRVERREGLRERVAQLAFDRPLARLARPAAEVRAVILERQLQTQVRRS